MQGEDNEIQEFIMPFLKSGTPFYRIETSVATT